MHHFKKHLEWVAFATGLLLLALMDPANAGSSLCLFEWIGIDFCPGEGLGHSISYSFRGNFDAAFQAHIAGPFTILILTARIASVWRTLYHQSTPTKELLNNG